MISISVDCQVIADTTIVISTKADSTGAKGDTSIAKNNFFRGMLASYYPNPKKAGLFSFVVPGAGQIYNKRAWKIAIWYPLYGALGYSIVTNTKRYKRYNTAVELKLQGLPTEFDDVISSVAGLRAYRDLYRKRNELSYVGISLTHILQVLDAYVDAHLKTFNMNDEIGMQIQPVIFPGPQGLPVAGIGILMNLQKSRK